MKISDTTKRVTTADLRNSLLVRYEGEAWALFHEVPDGTGIAKTRTADAIAMSLWPSRGLLLHGHELKASRSDWLKELSQPAKAESICRYCDRWWIVAAPNIVRLDELPPTWGLLVLKGRGLVAEVPAPELSPLPIDRNFLAGLLRASTRSVAKEDNAIRRAEFDRGRDAGRKEVNRDGDRHKEMLDKLVASVRAFEEATGVSVNGYGYDKDLAAVIREAVAARRVEWAARRSAGDVYRAANAMLAVLKQHDLLPTE